jgi:hypothetical protein
VATRTPFKSKITCNRFTSQKANKAFGESTPKVDGISCNFFSPRTVNLATHQLLKNINIEELAKSTS